MAPSTDEQRLNVHMHDSHGGASPPPSRQLAFISRRWGAVPSTPMAGSQAPLFARAFGMTERVDREVCRP